MSRTARQKSIKNNIPSTQGDLDPAPPVSQEYSGETELLAAQEASSHSEEDSPGECDAPTRKGYLQWLEDAPLESAPRPVAAGTKADPPDVCADLPLENERTPAADTSHWSDSYRLAVQNVSRGAPQPRYALLRLASQCMRTEKVSLADRVRHVYSPWQHLVSPWYTRQRCVLYAFLLGVACSCMPSWCVGLPHGVLCSYALANPRICVFPVLVAGTEFHTYAAALSAGSLLHRWHAAAPPGDAPMVLSGVALLFSLCSCFPWLQRMSPCVVMLALFC